MAKEKAPKLSKEEKKEAKAQKKQERKANAATPEGIETRTTIIKSVTAVICAAAICFSASTAVGNYCEAVKKAAEVNAAATPTASQGGAAVATDDGFAAGDTGAVVADDTATDTTDAAATDATDATATADATATDAGKTAAKTADPTSYNKAQVVEYYNSCLKKSYMSKGKIERTETIAIKVDEASGGDVVTNFVNNTILPKYAGTTTSSRDLKGTEADAKDCQDFAAPYGLTAAGAKTATITKSGSNYLITIVTVAEKSTLETPPAINKTCSHPLDLATVDISPAKVTKADFTYPGTTLKATVDANGKVLQSSISQPLSGTGEGKLGLSLHATLSGSLEQTCKYTYA